MNVTVRKPFKLNGETTKVGAVVDLPTALAKTYKAAKIVGPVKDADAEPETVAEAAARGAEVLPAAEPEPKKKASR